MSAEDGYRNLSAGLAVGLACLASGLGMAKFLESHARSVYVSDRREGNESEEPLLLSSRPAVTNFWTFTFVLVFLEAIGLYGLIVALFLMGPN